MILSNFDFLINTDFQYKSTIPCATRQFIEADYILGVLKLFLRIISVRCEKMRQSDIFLGYFRFNLGLGASILGVSKAHPQDMD